jgi:hypothetical protein
LLEKLTASFGFDRNASPPVSWQIAHSGSFSSVVETSTASTTICCRSSTA